MLSSDQQPLIDYNPVLQKYYASLESRIGYQVFLGGSRHFGYYARDTYWPFPVGKALRAMEDHLFEALKLGNGARVLDAGCGEGYVAVHMAERGLHVEGIDVVDLHIKNARRKVQAEGWDKTVTIRKMDYHHLDLFDEESFDGVYTSETLVHATDPERVLREFFRVLKPGGSIAMHEYEHRDTSDAPEDFLNTINEINRYTAMPANADFEEGVIRRILEETGFENVVIEDLTMNVMPMLRLFFVIAYIPFLLIRLLGLQGSFVNTLAGYSGYRARKYWKYVSVSGRKPTNQHSDFGGSQDEKKSQ